MPRLPNQDYLENCIVFLYEKNVVLDNVIDREVARIIFKDECTKIFGTHHNFYEVLKGWEHYQYINFLGNSIKFKDDVVQKILLEHDIKQKRKRSRPKKRSKPKCAEKYCKVCNRTFISVDAYVMHVNKNAQHQYRKLYINKSKSLSSSFEDVIVELNPGAGSKPELLVLRKDVSMPSLTMRNKSADSYCIESVIELHLPSCPIHLLREDVPVIIRPDASALMKVNSSFYNNDSQIFVHVFTVRNLTTNVSVDFVKEIIIHINSEVFDELLPTVPFHKNKAVQNDIKTNKFIRANVPKSGAFEGTVPLKSYDVPVYLKRILNAGLKPYEGITKEETVQLQQILKLLKVSKSNDCLTKQNYYELLRLLLFIEEHQMSRDIRNYDMETKEILPLKRQNYFELKVPGLAEHRPSLLPGDSVFIKDRDGKDTYQGVVRDIKESSVVLNFNKKFQDVYVKNQLFSVTYDYNRSNIRAEHRSVELINKHKAVAHFFAKHTGKKALRKYNIVWFNDKIKNNPEQQQAVSHILSESSYPAPYLIFGPPGTGKTMTIIEAISQIWKLKPNARMLVCAPSNSVANEIACRLVEYVPHGDLFRYLAVSYHLTDTPEKIRSFVNYDEGDYFHPTFHELVEYRIVITTLVNASRIVSFGVPAKHFSYVFIDESGHATETETLIPIAGVLTAKGTQGALHGQVVLAGDPQQLGPVIHSALAKQYGFGTSMLERMMTTLKLYRKDEEGNYNPRALTKLLHNYRSHPKILKVPNRLFYENELIPKGDELVNVAVGWKELPNPKVPIIFHSVVGTDQREANSPSYFNIQEVELVVHYLNLLIGTRLKGMLITQEHIGIIAPYRKQVQKIRQACERQNWTKITIGSVEQFQGQERLIIISSTVRSQPKLLKFDSKFHLGFLNNPKRFNVAITRSKSLLIVIGNPNLLQHDKHWKEFIKYCKDNRCFTGSPFEFSPRVTDKILQSLNMAKLRINDVADFARGNA